MANTGKYGYKTGYNKAHNNKYIDENEFGLEVISRGELLH